MESIDEDRISQLEQRVAALERALDVRSGSEQPVSNSEELGEGAVSFSGNIKLGQRHYQYEWIRPTSFLMEQPWDEHIERLAALAHPVRAEIMRRLLYAPATIAELVDEGIVTSTGTGYHHVNALHAAGWVTKSPHGYDVPPARVIPLLTAILIGEAHQ